MRPDSPARLYLSTPSSQGSSSQHSVRQRALRSLERYFYLILFNYYLHEQVGPGGEWTHAPSLGALPVSPPR